MPDRLAAVFARLRNGVYSRRAGIGNRWSPRSLIGRRRRSCLRVACGWDGLQRIVARRLGVPDRER
jgi:hypothetical protein